MTGTITAIVAAALGSVGAYFGWKASAVRQRRLAEDDIKAENEALDAKKQEIRSAVYEFDDDKLNQIAKKLLED